MQPFFENTILERKNLIKRVFFTLVRSKWDEQLCALYQKYLGVTLSYTQVTHTAGIWDAACH